MMGYAERANRDNPRPKNGPTPPTEPDWHAPWCRLAVASDVNRVVGLPTDSPCSCKPIPALRCDDCGAVFTPRDHDTPERFANRVKAHAMVHPTPPTFTQGTTARQRGETL